MTRTLTAAAAMAVLLTTSGLALAQARGTYQNSCTDISQNGSTLIARCKGPGGMYDTTLDLDRCGNIGVANSGGRLTCGNQRGSARQSRDDGDSQRSYGDNGYNNYNGYNGYNRRPRYDDDSRYQQPYGYAPRRSYREPDYAAPRSRYYSPDSD